MVLYLLWSVCNAIILLLLTLSFQFCLAFFESVVMVLIACVCFIDLQLLALLAVYEIIKQDDRSFWSCLRNGVCTLLSYLIGFSDSREQSEESYCIEGSWRSSICVMCILNCSKLAQWPNYILYQSDVRGTSTHGNNITFSTPAAGLVPRETSFCLLIGIVGAFRYMRFELLLSTVQLYGHSSSSNEIRKIVHETKSCDSDLWIKIEPFSDAVERVQPETLDENDEQIYIDA